MISADALTYIYIYIYRCRNRKVILGPASHAWSARPAGKNQKQAANSDTYRASKRMTIASKTVNPQGFLLHNAASRQRSIARKEADKWKVAEWIEVCFHGLAGFTDTKISKSQMHPTVIRGRNMDKFVPMHKHGVYVWQECGVHVGMEECISPVLMFSVYGWWRAGTNACLLECRCLFTELETLTPQKAYQCMCLMMNFHGSVVAGLKASQSNLTAQELVLVCHHSVCCFSC